MENKKLSIKSRKFKGESSVISARIPSDMVDKIDSISEKTGRNRNEIIQMCLEYALDNVEISEDN